MLRDPAGWRDTASLSDIADRGSSRLIFPTAFDILRRFQEHPNHL